MAMKKCPDCAELVQADARLCRYCRHEFPQPVRSVSPPPTTRNAMPSWMIVLIVILGLILLSLISRPKDADRSASQRPVEATPAPSSSSRAADDLKIRFMAERRLKAELRDPDSMEVRNARIPFGTAYVCGEVNAKNGFGGLTGFKRFIVGAASGSPIAIDDGSTVSPEEFNKLWADAC